MSVTILGIETSCDETAAAVVTDGWRIDANVIASQVDLHARFGGVVPEVASRQHLEGINPVIAEALAQARIGFTDLDAVAVTMGPGLAGCLLVGLMAAKTIAMALDIPLVGVHHLEGHLYANFLVERDLPFSLLALIVSGGHTDLFLVERHGDYRLLGRTRDDAAGEAFDKVARVLGLGYPGGPLLEKAAQEGDPEAVALPRAYLGEDSLDFSFSGLKTAVVTYLEKEKRAGGAVTSLADLAAGFQKAVTDVLVDKVMSAAERFQPARIVLAGGVAANGFLRRALEHRAAEQGLAVTVPPPILCTDNAAMVACAGYYRYLRGEFAPLTLNTTANLPLGHA